MQIMRQQQQRYSESARGGYCWSDDGGSDAVQMTVRACLFVRSSVLANVSCQVHAKLCTEAFNFVSTPPDVATTRREICHVCVQPPTAAGNATLLAFAAVRRAAAAPLLLGAGRVAIDRCLLAAGPTAANPPHAAAAVDSWDKQTDGHRAVTYITDCAAYCARSVKNALYVCLCVRSVRVCRVRRPESTRQRRRRHQ